MPKNPWNVLFGSLAAILTASGAALALNPQFRADIFILINSNHNNIGNSATPPDVVREISTLPQKEPTFICEKDGENIAMLARIDNHRRKVAGFIKDWDQTYTKIERCNQVTYELNQSVKNYHPVAIAIGEHNGESIMCVSQGVGKGCLDDRRKGQIMTIPRDQNAIKVWETFVESLKPGAWVASAPKVINTNEKIYLYLEPFVTGKKDFIKTGN
jgi:Circadian oscillating protein COP23